MMNFKDAPLDAVLDYLSQFGGFVVVREGPPVTGVVNVLSKQPVTRAEAVAILAASLKSNGFTAIQNGRELHIVPRDKAKKGNIPVHFGADPKEIPNTDELITQVIPLKNVDAGKLRDDLKPLTSTDADVAANEASNTIVITDTCSSIHRLAEIIFAMDQEEGTTTAMRIVQLHSAKAADAVKLIETVFKDEGGGGGGPRGGPQQMVMGPNGPQPAQPPGGGGTRRSKGHVIAAADDRTNIIVVSGPTDSLKTIDEILQKLDANPVPTSEMKSYPLRYADAEATSKLITSMFQPRDNNNDSPFRIIFFGGGGGGDQSKVKITSNFDERTNTVIVSAPAATLVEIDKLIANLDAGPAAASTIRIFPLRYADSYSASKLINSIFNPTPSDSARVSERIYIYDEGAQPKQAKGAKVNATSDDRTNAVIVTAPSESMKIIEGIVHQIDANPGSEETMMIYHLRNAQSDNLEIVLNTLFGNVQAPRNQQDQNQQNQQNQNNNPNNFFQNNQVGNNGRNGINNNNNNGNQNRNNRQNRQNRRQNQPNLSQQFHELTGQVLVVSEPDTNSLIVITAVKYKAQVKAIIDELDRPAAQVLIKVLVAEVTHDNSADFGVDFSILNTRPNGNGQSFGQTFGAPNTGLVINFLENNLNATLHALAQQNKLDVLSRPYILASDNQPADILVGQLVPIVRSNSQNAFGQAISQYDYQSVGIILNVTPHINPDGQVILDVAPEISQLTAQTVNVAPGVNVPVIADRSANSRVAIRDGQTIVIGGLMQDEKTLTVSKVPILGDIPVIKYLFSRTQVDRTKTELLIFLTPHVAQTPDLLKPMSQDELKGTQITPNAVGPGIFQEHMEGLRRGSIPDKEQAPPRPPVFEPEPTTQPADEIKLQPTTAPSNQQTVESVGAANSGHQR